MNVNIHGMKYNDVVCIQIQKKSITEPISHF